MVVEMSEWERLEDLDMGSLKEKRSNMPFETVTDFLIKQTTVAISCMCICS